MRIGGKPRARKVRKMRKTEGRMVNRREERVYIVVQAARRRLARRGRARPDGVVHRWANYTSNTLKARIRFD